MNKITFAIPALIILLSGCGAQTAPATPPAPQLTSLSIPADPAAITDSDGSIWHTYDAVSGVKFEYMDKFSGEKLFPVRTTDFAAPYPQATKIGFVELQKNGTMMDALQTLEVFPKLANDSIEKAIAGVIKNSDKNPSDCKIEPSERDPNAYRIYSAKPTKYTDDELNKIAQRQKDYVPDLGPETADYLKSEFDRLHLISLCSNYADPATNGTSSRYPGFFLYDPSVNKTTFVYVPPQYDPLVHRNLTLTPSK